MNEKELSPKELDNIANKIGVDNLLDTDGKAYKDKGLEYMVFDTKDEILANNNLIRTPIVRFERNVTCGYEPTEWKIWVT